MRNNAVCNYDFTLWDKGGGISPPSVKAELNKISKKWCFQLEDAGSGKHYQGRFSLKIKKRISEFSLLSAHLSVTSKENIDNDFYVCKEETRIAGPWRNDDKYIPRQVREIDKLLPWQEFIEADIGVWNTRTINIVYDNVGCIGKSTIVAYLCNKGGTATVPPLNNYKDIMGMVLSMPTKSLYLIDMPRGLDKNNQCEFFAAIEHIKNGHAFDLRYSYKEKWFDCPNIWVFTNRIPDLGLLSMDRWKLWEVRRGDLVALRCNTITKSSGTSGTS